MAIGDGLVQFTASQSALYAGNRQAMISTAIWARRTGVSYVSSGV